jgi:hypothetical protein
MLLLPHLLILLAEAEEPTHTESVRWLPFPCVSVCLCDLGDQRAGPSLRSARPTCARRGRCGCSLSHLASTPCSRAVPWGRWCVRSGAVWLRPARCGPARLRARGRPVGMFAGWAIRAGDSGWASVVPRSWRRVSTPPCHCDGLKDQLGSGLSPQLAMVAAAAAARCWCRM